MACGWALLAWFGAQAVAVAQGDTLRLRIRAINPSNSNAQPVEIRSDLPRGVKPDDVLDPAGLEVRYDVKRDLYYVYGDMELAPTNVRTFDIVLRDVWQLSPDEVRRMAELAERRRQQLTDTDFDETAARLQVSIESAAEQILRRQEENAIGRVRPVEHIRAYELNEKVWNRAREEMGHLESFVIAAGKDPEIMAGVVDRQPVRGEYEPDEDASIVISFTVTNPARTNRALRVQRDLPGELRAEDVIDSGELSLAFDAAENTLYVYGEAVPFEAGETRTFEVRVRDRWAVTDQRMDALHARGTNLAAWVAAAGDFPSIQTRLDDVQDGIAALRREQPPETMGADYVAFFRRQHEELDRLERMMLSVEDLLNKRKDPTPPILSKAKWIEVEAPDRRTTWIIIYSILGLATLLAVAFYARWHFSRGRE